MSEAPDHLTEETIFTWGAPPLKFGAGAVDEIGFEMAQFGVKRVLILTDPTINASGIPHRIAGPAHAERDQLRDLRRRPRRTDRRQHGQGRGVRAEAGPWDGFIAVGGGSSIDTAKAVNLIDHRRRRADGLHQQADRAAPRRRRGQLKPLIAIPTTAGTGSESTAMCVLDVLSMKVKTGISHWRLRPTLAIIDPLLTLSLPAEVTAASGMDIVCHALESYTARWYASFDRKTPEQRVTYCGSNPVSDLWCEKAMALVAKSFRRRGARTATTSRRAAT